MPERPGALSGIGTQDPGGEPMVMLDDVFRPANRVVVRLLRSPVGKLAGGALLVLEYVGRSSGRGSPLPSATNATVARSSF
ncbi:MAG: hypothetical protein R2789_14840 [Microthrixaceae bacterium]